MLEMLPIMQTLCLMPSTTQYAQNYAGIISISIDFRYVRMYVHTTKVLLAQLALASLGYPLQNTDQLSFKVDK